MGRREEKPKRRTRERILETALALFNDHGEPGITATAIAETMGISPGNLHYHFSSKQEIVESLVASFRADIADALTIPERDHIDIEDVWLFLHLIFESIWRYRFLYRDLNELLSRHRAVETQVRWVLARKIEVARTLLNGLAAEGQLNATPMEIETLAVTMTVLTTYWLSFEFARAPRATPDSRSLARGAFHVMSAAAPYLAPPARLLLDRLAVDYLD
jgi:AcrR family transcriptional regulator